MVAARATQGGFTITELMIVVAVASVLVAAALPSYNQFVRNQRVKTASFDLFSTLIQARSEAIVRNASVTITPTGGNWANGWTVTDAGGATLRSESSIPNITLTGPASVTYNGSGRLTATVTPFEMTATGSGITARCITLDLSGRPVSKATTC
jgi:type IV fimbrial biogenesis protein FimT